MAKMWRGPSEALTAAHGDPLWAAIHRRNGKLGVACDTDQDGLTARFYSVTKRGDAWYQHDLGRVEGADPILTALWGSHRFTAPDAELFKFHYAYLDRLFGEIEMTARDVLKRIEGQTYELEDVMAHVRY